MFRKKKEIIIFVLIIIGGFTWFILHFSKKPNIIIDVNQYSYITKDELIQKLGEPIKIIDEIYTYNEMEFTIKKDVVVGFKYLPNNSIKYNLQNDVFAMFGINYDKTKMKNTVANGSTYKFQDVSENIYEVEVYGLNKTEKTFDMIFIKYQK